MTKLETLRSRQAFALVKNKGRRVFQKNFILQMYERTPTALAMPRWGFIITKKMGSAVVRNLIRRRLREMIRQLPPNTTKLNADYVVVARHGFDKTLFALLNKEFNMAFNEIYATSKRYA